MIVLDRIARPEHHGVLEAGDRAQQLFLHVARQRGRDAVGIDGVVVQALGLEEDLVPLAVGEPDDLVLDRGAVAHALRGDLAGVHRRPMKIAADQHMALGRRVGDPAVDLRIGDPVGHEARGAGRVVAGLDGPGPGRSIVLPSIRGGVPVFSRARPMPWRRRLSASRTAGRSPMRPAGQRSSPEMDLAAQERARRQDDGTGPERLAGGDDAGDASAAQR